jgi:hypothetical protein
LDKEGGKKVIAYAQEILDQFDVWGFDIDSEKAEKDTIEVEETNIFDDKKGKFKIRFPELFTEKLANFKNSRMWGEDDVTRVIAATELIKWYYYARNKSYLKVGEEWFKREGEYQKQHIDDRRQIENRDRRIEELQDSLKYSFTKCPKCGFVPESSKVEEG